MSTYLIILSAFIAAGGVAFLVYSLGLRGNRNSPDSVWLESFSTCRYRPMLRLLSDEDAAYMRAQGLSPAAIRRLQTERRAIFRVYLNNIIRDFHVIHRAARTLVLVADADCPELASRLIGLRIDFSRAVLAVRFRLALHTLGVGTVDVSALVAAIEEVHADLRMAVLAPGATPAAA